MVKCFWTTLYYVFCVVLAKYMYFCYMYVMYVDKI
jgi:hypothetical protein